MRIGLTQILKDSFGVSEKDFNEAQKIKSEKGGNTGHILVEKKLITETQLLVALSFYYDTPIWPKIPIDNIISDFTQNVSIQFLKKYFMVPLNRYPKSTKENPQHGYIIAINDPSCFQPLDDLVRLLNIDDLQVVLSKKSEILSAINMAYDLGRDSAEQLVQNMEVDENVTGIIEEIEDTADLLDDTSDAPIIKLVNHIIAQSYKERASDIHIEPYQNGFKVRYRVDGILYDLLTPPKWIQSALVSRIKVMAKLNIAEKRLPQDGRFEVKIGDQQIDLRVSTIPTSFGERIVLRILSKSSKLLRLSDFGFSPERLNMIETLIKSPNGIILVTGPTGSGKTTTLYAILSAVNTPDVNIITIEDPVEYQINGISQIQVNPKIELTFARGLRSIVRQDPDVILIGEIRDQETAEIAVQSALTGHLVFSTLHTNDSASSITRLVDIGIEPFLISSSLIAVIAQRLVRLLCVDCKEAYVPDEFTLKTIDLTQEMIEDRTIYKAKGCQKCFNTGYRGRKGVFEILLMDNSLKSLILKTFDSNQIMKEALRQNMITLYQDGIQKILGGITTIEEVLRVTHR